MYSTDLPWPIPDQTGLRDRLVAAYSTDRGYHDLRHLAEVLQRVAELGEAQNIEVVLAAWFHDAVHDACPGGTGADEERSALLAESELREHGVDTAEVARLVRLTEHHDPAPEDRNGIVLCDADLAILAAPAKRYREYVLGVRQEYAVFSDAEFRAGRLAVLEDLVARQPLFGTEHARHAWGPRARANLAAEIATLSAQG